MALVTLYDTSILLFIKSGESLKAILQKAKDHSSDANTTYPSLRLYDDMLPLSFQVQIYSNVSKKAVERLVPAKNPGAWEDNEKTLDELITRVDKTLDLLKSVTPEDLAGKEDAVVELGLGPGRNATAKGKGYVFGYALPNVFFHVTTAYAILRAKGVPLGKQDYLAPYLVGNLLSGP